MRDVNTQLSTKGSTQELSPIFIAVPCCQLKLSCYKTWGGKEGSAAVQNLSYFSWAAMGSPSVSLHLPLQISLMLAALQG